MAITYKISSELYDESFGLIALHSSMPTYSIVYQINIALGIQLGRLENDFQVGDRTFPIYEWYDEKSDTAYFLYGNKSKEEEIIAPAGFFFQESTMRTYYLLEEKKETDFFLRIDSDIPKLESTVLAKIKKINGVSLSYLVDVETLKAKQNLIL